MANGLIGSFIDTVSSLQQMDLQKQEAQARREREKQEIVEFEVNRALQEEGLRLREEGMRMQDEARDATLALRQQIEDRRAEDSANRQKDRLVRQNLAQKRIDQGFEKMASTEQLAIMRAGENLYRDLRNQGVDPDDARAYALEHSASLADKYGIQLPQPAAQQPFGGQPTEGPMTLSAGGPVAAPAPKVQLPNVLPKVAAEIDQKLKSAIKLGTAAEVDRKRADLIEEQKAQLVANKVLEQEYKQNRNRLQEERLKLAPLEATAKRLGIATEKLRAQKLTGDIRFGEIRNATANLKLEQARNSPTWSHDAKEMRKWLGDEYGLAQKNADNALKHLAGLKESQRQTDAMITNIQSLQKRGKATPQDLAQLDAYVQAKLDRQNSINFYQSEYDTAKKLKDGFRSEIDAMVGIGSTPMTSKGTPDRVIMRLGNRSLTEVYGEGPPKFQLKSQQPRGSGRVAQVKPLTQAIANEFMRKAKGNRAKAKQMAEAAGYR